MKLTFLGTASMLSSGDGNFHSNMLLEKNGKTLLIDCGSDINHSLQAANKSALDIDAVFISHLHGDHAGGLEWLGFMRLFHPGSQGKPKLFVPNVLMHDLRKMLLPSMGTLGKGFNDPMTLEDYFQVEEMPYIHSTGYTLKWNGEEFLAIPQDHVKGETHFMMSFGLILHSNDTDRVGYISSDTSKFSEVILKDVDNYDFIFQDCELTQPGSGVHTNFMDLQKLPEDVKNKMWLYHYQPHMICGRTRVIVSDQFAGIVEPRQEFEI